MTSTQLGSQKQTTLSGLIDYYEVCNKCEGKSPKTITWYSANLGHFCQYLGSRHLPDSIDGLNTQLLREYVLHLLGRNKLTGHPYAHTKAEPLSAATVHGHVRTLRAFFAWLAREGFVDHNLASGLRPPKVPVKVVSVLSDEEIKSILRTFNLTNPCDARNRTIFMMLLDTGLRIGELITLKMDDVRLNEGFVKVMGKGQKERLVPVGNNAQRALQRYLFRYRPTPVHPGIGNVFLSIHGGPLTENSMKLMFARMAQRSAVKRLHAHLCRHTFATRFLTNGGDIFTLQQILGHSTLEMVRRYASLSSDHVKLQHQRFSPLDRLGSCTA